MGDELTREMRDRRIAVCRDVVERIDARRLRVLDGYYIRIRIGSDPAENVRKEITSKLSNSQDLRDVADTIEQHCTVCARGGMLLSKARLYDNVPSSTLIREGWFEVGQSSTTNPLLDTFDAETLEAIESAFEEEVIRDFVTSCDRDDTQNYAAEERLEDFAGYGRSLPASPAARLRVIMENLIRNDGEFLLPPEFATPALTSDPEPTQ